MQTQPKHNYGKCKYCGSKHEPIMQNCPAYGRKCPKCKKYNYFASVCNAKINLLEQKEFVDESDDDTDEHSDLDEDNIASLDELKSITAVIDSLKSQRKEWPKDILVENININFKLDIGADVNTIPWDTYLNIKTTVKLEPPTKFIQAFGGDQAIFVFNRPNKKSSRYFISFLSLLLLNLCR